MTGVEVREATAADAPGIRRLFGRVFPAELTSEEWDWKFARNPDGWYGVVAVRDGEIVGNYAGWGMRLHVDGQSVLSYSVGDVATDPAVRGVGGRVGVYREMAARFYAEVGARGVPFCFGFPNPRALEISHRLVGSRTLFPVREIRIPCDALPPAPAGVESGDTAGESLDALWQAASRALPYAAVRDRARANWRFHARPGRYYRMVTVSDSEGLRGWAVLSVGNGNALVADLLVRAGEGVLPLLSAAAAEARAMGAPQLTVWEPPGGPAREALGRVPGERRQAGFPMIVRVFDEDATRRFGESVALTPAMYDVV
jgi:hypothetical protein